MTDEEGTPPGRTPGRYFVYGFVSFVVVLFGVSFWLSRTLEPAADKFHNPPGKSRGTAR